MKEIDKSYFQNISNIVNTEVYNIGQSYSNIMNFNLGNISDQTSSDFIKSKMKEDGFVVIKTEKSLEHDRDRVESWLKEIFGVPFFDKNPGKLA